MREVLVEQQRGIGRRGGFVVDGRDIGTVVFPDAGAKPGNEWFYLAKTVSEI